MCSSRFTVFFQLDSQKTFRFSKQIMSMEKYPCVFLHQIEAIVYITLLLTLKLREAELICYKIETFDLNRKGSTKPPPSPIPPCLFRKPWIYNSLWSKDMKTQLKLFNKSGCLENREPLWPQNLKTKIPHFWNFLGRGNPLTSSFRPPPPPKKKVCFSKGGGQEAILVIFDVYKNGNTLNKKFVFCLYSLLFLSLPPNFFSKRKEHKVHKLTPVLHFPSPQYSLLFPFTHPKKLSYLRGWGR